MNEPAPALLTLEQAARRLGVHYMTIYRYVRLGQVAAHQADGRWWIEERALDALANRPVRPGPSGTGPRWSELRQRLLSRLDDGDLGGAWSVFDGAFRAGQPPVDLYVELLGPVLRQVGDQWASGQRSIESEHRASSLALRLVGRVGARGVRAGRRRRSVVVLGGAPGDPHQLPGLMVADVLRWEGFRVVDLGADVPLESFVEAATSTSDLVAVGISLSARRHRGAVSRVLANLRDAVPGTLLLAGGPALPDVESARSLGADGWAPHAGAVAELVAAGR
jgi:MerR family transcriptional regulator, light-induced transcriptional regulator